MNLRKSLSSASFFASAALLASVNGMPAHAAPAHLGATAASNVQDEAQLVDSLHTATPIKHLVVIFDENVSFDHYFATYPKAANPQGEPPFIKHWDTPQVNNLITVNLLENNPNFSNSLNGVNRAEPFRLDRSQAATADQNHSYTPEQQAYDDGKADLFPLYTGAGTPGGAGAFGTSGQVMGYYDGNTVTALWQYAAHYAMSDNAYTDTYGPSTPGALEVVSGQTNGLVLPLSSKSSYYVADGAGGKTLINDVDPAYDVCSSKTDAGYETGKNIGDLLNAAKIPWGGFMGGFDVHASNPNGTTGCGRSTASPTVGETVADYVPHHNWFQYFPSTANYSHARPATLTNIGYTFASNGAVDPANHEYDLTDFYHAVADGDFPAVSYIKLPAYQDGHAGYSDPLDEQKGLVSVINLIMSQRDWLNTAIIVTWDDSDGWYDHRFAQPGNASFDAKADQLNGPGKCGDTTVLRGVASAKPVNGRCGPGTRIPFLVISPWARPNFIGKNQVTQASVVKFIEYNWLHNQRLGGGSFDTGAGLIEQMFNFNCFPWFFPLILDPTTGEPSRI